MASTPKERALWRAEYAARSKKRGVRKKLREQWREAQARKRAEPIVKLAVIRAKSEALNEDLERVLQTTAAATR